MRPRAAVLAIVPVGPVRGEAVRILSKSLKFKFEATFDDIVVEKTPLVFPPKAYIRERRQYLADVLLEAVYEFAARRKYTRALGVTEEDIYSGLLNFVLGIAQMGPGLGTRAALVSVARLDPRFWGEEFEVQLFRERLVKEATHELGHTLGLGHCTTPKCVMNFSNTLTEADWKEPEFCEACHVALKRWY
ncbi:MAG: archaemetzincin family Zn-dependent metalloprotease [Promethearchaeota archaeon]